MADTTDFDLAALDARDEADLAIRHPTTNAVTTWIWTFYGPGHPKTVELADRISRQALHKQAAQRQAQVNGKKWKEEERTPDEVLTENVNSVVERTKSFTPVKINGEEMKFSPDAARNVLMDPKKGWLLRQIMDFLADEASFIQPSGKT